MWKVLSVVGAFGPWVMAAVIIAENIIDECSYFKIGALILWQPLSITINGLLKEIINQERPSGSIHVNELEAIIDEGTKGMPSGHAQLVGSELMLSLISNTNVVTKYIMIGQTCITLYQRWAYKKHSIMQLIIGFFIGIFYSTVFWFAMLTF